MKIVYVPKSLVVGFASSSKHEALNKDTQGSCEVSLLTAGEDTDAPWVSLTLFSVCVVGPYYGKEAACKVPCGLSSIRVPFRG